MPVRTWFARGGACLAAAVVAVALTACGSAPDPSTSIPPSGITASPSFEVLPESVLPTVAGMTYAESDASRAALARTHVGATLSAFSGGLARDLVVGGRTVGVAQVYRFADGIPTADREQFLPMLVYVDTGTQPAQQTLGGKKLMVVPDVAGQDRAVVAWAAGDKVVLLSAADVATARDLAGRWILSDL